MKKQNKYGYKVCYREYGKTKLKIHLICNNFDLAIWEVQYFENHSQHNRKTNDLIVKPKWFVIPIRTIFEYIWLWHGCPF